ncbi:MAG TPA: acyltransferase family protein [Xanthobacteraceae bacterium]|nr:acyltransferase family protein [Xanthobacteraceae bacterium]
MLLTRSAVEASDDIHVYKPFVDGLRAIAILTVIAGHLELPGASGGFVGVDVFFVISGYLIINQIAADIRRGRFSLLDFWARRTLRILPAFLLVAVVCLLLGVVVLVQFEYRQFADSFLFSTIMQANHYFLAKQDYFDTAAYAKPLLHTWTLSVEEQFYAVTPLILVGLTALTKAAPSSQRVWTGATAGLLVVSFAMCVALTRERHNVAFYVMPARGWEFMLGGLVPLLVVPARRLPAAAINALTIAGIGAIALALEAFGPESVYPSYRAALPVLGAVLIIVGGLADPRNMVARVLATPPFVAIGLVSYSWYLWHWPLLSFLRLANSGARDRAMELGAVALALVLAILTYRLVEQPVRAWRRRAKPRARTVVLAGLAACVLIGGAGSVWSKYAMPRLTPSLAGLETAPASGVAYPPVARHGSLIGDSHADMLDATLTEHARRLGASLTVTMYGGCPPLLRVTVLDYTLTPIPQCRDLYGTSLAVAGSEFAILAGRWTLYVTPPPARRDFHPYWLADPQTGKPAANPYALLARGLAATIAEAKRAGVRRILVIGQFPEFGVRVPNCVLRLVRLGIDRCSVPRAAFEAHRAQAMETLREVTAGLDGVRLIDPIDVFCTATVCEPHDGETVYFNDDNHLSPAGAERFYAAFEADMKWAMLDP